MWAWWQLIPLPSQASGESLTISFHSPLCARGWVHAAEEFTGSDEILHGNLFLYLMPD